MGKNKWMAVFIVTIMVLSVLGYVGSSFFSSEEERVEYKGLNLVKINNQWQLKAEGKNYYFQYLPQELENLSLPEMDLSGEKIYLGFQPGDQINTDKAFNQIGSLLYSWGSTPQEACLTEKGCPDIPLINCRDKKGVIIISGEKNNYTQDEKCLIITAVDNQELEKLTERLIYRLLGVM